MRTAFQLKSSSTLSLTPVVAREAIATDGEDIEARVSHPKRTGDVKPQPLNKYEFAPVVQCQYEEESPALIDGFLIAICT